MAQLFWFWHPASGAVIRQVCSVAIIAHPGSWFAEFSSTGLFLIFLLGLKSLVAPTADFLSIFFSEP